MVPQSLSAREVCAEVGIKIIRPGRRSATSDLETCAERTIEKLIERHGAGHARFVLRTIGETEGNAEELVAFTIEAVSRLVLAHPEWADRGLEWFEAFDRIDLKAIREQCRKVVRFVPMADGIGTIVFDRLLDLLGDPTPLRNPRGRRKMPATAEAASAAL